MNYDLTPIEALQSVRLDVNPTQIDPSKLRNTYICFPCKSFVMVLDGSELATCRHCGKHMERLIETVRDENKRVIKIITEDAGGNRIEHEI